MSDSDTPVRHGLVVLTAPLEAAGLDRRAVVGAFGDALVDETEGSLTAAWDAPAPADAARDDLVAKGLVEGESVFRVEVAVPSWMEAYNDVAHSMMEHGG
jgi:hypothetical protein